MNQSSKMYTACRAFKTAGGVGGGGETNLIDSTGAGLLSDTEIQSRPGF